MARSKGPNSTRPRKNPLHNRHSRAQRLRRALEKEAKMKLCKLQQITNESSQDCSQEMSNKDSVPTTSREILNPHEENKRTSDFSQNLIVIDSFSVIKTEIIDPSEKNAGLIFQDDSQCTTATNSVLVEDCFRKNEIVPIIKVEPESETPFLPQINIESSSSQKKNIGFNHAVHYNKGIKKILPTIESKSICGCLEKITMIKHLCESYLKLVQQDSTNKLCICNADNHTIPENMKVAELIKQLSSLLNPNFRKITCCMNEIDDLAD